MRVAALMALLLLALPGGQASHDDGVYDQPVWFEWDRAQLDILIVPPNHGQLYNSNGYLDGGDPFEATPLNSYLRAILATVEGWRQAMDGLGPAWMRQVELRAYVLGLDLVPPDALAEPEIVVVTDETKLYYLGVSVNTRPCLSDMSKAYARSFTYEDMYNIAGHEIGHCLGLAHVGGGDPTYDIMRGSYPYTAGSGDAGLNCQSNLNVAGLALVFGPLFGQPSGPAGRVPVADYATWPCG